MDKLYTSKETAELLAVALSTLATWRSQGKGPRYIKLGGAVRYCMDDVTKYVEQRQMYRPQRGAKDIYC
jgi:predicted site-specific integrase-resolvase